MNSRPNTSQRKGAFPILFGSLMAVFLWANAEAGEGMLTYGGRLSGQIDVAPGQEWTLGIEAGYSNFNMLRHKLQLRFAYETTRLETIFQEGLLKQDYYWFSPTWHWRRTAFLDPTFQLDAGYYKYDLEAPSIFKDLENTAWIFGGQFGLNFNFSRGQQGLHYQFGYRQAESESSLILPFTFSLVYWRLI